MPKTKRHLIVVGLRHGSCTTRVGTEFFLAPLRLLPTERLAKLEKGTGGGKKKTPQPAPGCQHCSDRVKATSEIVREVAPARGEPALTRSVV
jgi:hypothetical protein